MKHLLTTHHSPLTTHPLSFFPTFANVVYTHPHDLPILHPARFQRHRVSWMAGSAQWKQRPG